MATVDEPTVDGPTPLGLTLHGTREYYDRWYQVLLQHDPQTQENCVYYAVFTDRMPTWFEEATLEVEWIVRTLYESPLCKTCWRLHLQQEDYERHEGRFQISTLEIQVRRRWHELSWSQVRASVLHFVDLLPVWPAGVEYQQLIYRQTDLPEEYPTRQDLVRRLHWFDRESGGCIWDPESQPSTLASSLLPSSLPEPSSSSPPSSLPEPSSLATTSSQPSTLPAVPSQSQSTSRYNVKSHRETTLQEMQRQVYSESRKVQVLETAGQRERERLAGLEEEICQLRETNRRLTIAGAEVGLNVLQRDATIDRLDRAHQVQRNSWGTMREAQEREIRELQELRSRSFGRPTGREYVWVRGQPKRRRGRAVFPARVNCRPLWKENKRKVLKLLEIAEAGEIRIGDLDHAAKVDANKIKELEAELAAANETNQQFQQTHQQTVDDLQNRMDRMNDDLRGRARAIGSRHVAILDLREAMQVKNANIANLTRSIGEKEATIVARDSTIATKETAIVNLTQSRDEKEATITTHESTIANLTQSVNEKDLTIIARDSTINALQVSANQSSEAAKTRIVEVETLLATAEQSLVTANAEIDELASAAAAANGVIGAASTRINELEGSLGTAHSRVSVLEGSLAEANARVTTLEGSLGAANMRVTGFEESLATAKTENQNLSSSLSFVTTRYMERVSQMRASVTALEGSLAAANTEHQNLSSSLATAETENQNLASSLSFVTTRYMARVLQVRGLMYEVQGLMNDLATKNQQIVLLQESSRLTNQGAFQVRRQLANANVRNVALVSQVHRLLNQLQSGMARSDDQDEDLYVAALRFDLLQSQFATAVGERDYALAEGNARRDERDAARAERDTALEERDTARAERDTALEERDDLQTELDSDNRALHKMLEEVQQRRDEAVFRRDKIDQEFQESTVEAFRLRETIDTTQAQLETAQTQLQALQTRLNTTEGQLRTSQSDLRTSQSDLLAANNNLAREQESLRNSQAALVAANGNITRLEGPLRVAQESLRVSQESLGTSQANLQTANSDRERLQASLQTATTNLTQSQTDLQTANDTIEDLRLQLDAAQTDSNQINETLTATSNELAVVLQERDDHMDESGANHHELLDLRDQVEGYETEVTRFEAEITNLQAQVSAKDSEVTRLKTELKQSGKSVKEKGSEVTRLKTELAARDAELLRSKNELAQSVKAGKQKDSELSNKVTELSNKATELSDLNTRVSQQAQAIKDKDTELFNLQKQNSGDALELSRQATTITELEQQITQMEEKVADDHQGYNDTIESHQEEQAKLEKEVKELKAAKSAAEGEIQGLKTEKASLFQVIKNSTGGDPVKVKKLEEKVKELESRLKSMDWAKFIEDYDSQDVTFSSDRTALELDSALNDVRKRYIKYPSDVPNRKAYLQAIGRVITYKDRAVDDQGHSHAKRYLKLGIDACQTWPTNHDLSDPQEVMLFFRLYRLVVAQREMWVESLPRKGT